MAWRRKRIFLALGFFAAGFLSHSVWIYFSPPLPPCFLGDVTMPDGTLSGQRLAYRHCLRFGPVERIRGRWFTGTEESSFEPLAGSPGAGAEDLWLEMDDRDREELLRSIGTVSIRPSGEGVLNEVELDFYGRISEPIDVYGLRRRVLVIDSLRGKRLVAARHGI